LIIKKIIIFFLLSAYTVIQVSAQSKADTVNTMTKGRNHSVSIGLNIPFGDFSSTHNLGVGINYSWSKHRFGVLSAIPFKTIGFTFNIGVDYYLGKKETVGVYNYKYGNYSYLHTYGGIIFNPGRKGNISLAAGPAVGLYNGNTQFNVGINLSGNYYLNKHIAVTPAILFMKESVSDPLWSASLRASIVF